MSATTIQAPACSEVTELMKDLFGLNVSESSPTVHPLYSIAEYCNPDGEAVGYMACDLATGCRLGAALTQVPAGRVDEAVKDGAMPENLAENLYEVFNISVNLIAPEGVRLVLNRVAQINQTDTYNELKEKLEAAQSTQYGFDVARYGVCCLTIAG